MDDLRERMGRLSPERRALLRKMLDDEGIELPRGEEAARPSNEVEAILCAVWGEVLGVEVGVRDNYFELGGDSIMSVLVVSKARAAGVPLTTELLLHTPTIAEIAARLSADAPPQRQPPNAAGRHEAARPAQEPTAAQSFPLTSLQQGMLFHTLSAPGSGAYLSQFCCRLRGPLDPARFRAAWAELVLRHDALRTCVVRDGDGRPQQFVQPRAELELTYKDWTGVDETQRERALAEFLEADSRLDFDLTSPPLMRCALLKTGDESHACVLTHHHILLDGWSQQLLFRELFEVYAAAESSHEPAHDDDAPRLSFRAYVRWLDAQDKRAAEAFWKRYLHGSPRAPLHTSARGQSTEHAAYALESLLLLETETEALRAAARRLRLTPNVLLEAAWALVLSQLKGQEDVTFGVAASVRPAELSGADTLVGLCINTLPLRVICRGRGALCDWLEDLKRQQQEWQRYLYASLTEVRRWHVASSEQPLFESLFVHENFPDLLAGATSTPLVVEDVRFVMREQYPLVVVIMPGARTRVDLKYDPARFSTETARRILNTFDKAVEALTGESDKSLRTVRETLANSWREHGRARQAVEERFGGARASGRVGRRMPVRLSGEQLVSVEPTADYAPPVVVRPAIDSLLLAEWARANRDWLEGLRLRHGAVRLRGFSVGGVEGFRRLLEALGAEPLEYVERSTPRRELGRGIYTSTDYPPDQFIRLHNENAYASTWPLQLIFYCAQPPAEGGRTPLADCRRVLRNLNPEVVRRFREKGVLYLRNYSEGLGLPWQSVFGTADPALAEEYCRRAGYDFEWLPGGRLRTRRVAPAVAVHPRTGEEVWFNHAAFFHFTSLEPKARAALLRQLNEDELPNNTYYGDGTPFEPAVVEQLRDAYDEAALSFAWEPDDVLLIDNMLVAHGRTPFAGPRQILVAMSEPFGPCGGVRRAETEPTGVSRGRES